MEASFNYDEFQYQNFGRQFGGRGIPWNEYSKVLNSFALNKTPGNDGLPIEFYPTFWNSDGELLVQSFNESFTKGEMSQSQRQAVVTPIEKKMMTVVSTKYGDQLPC